MRFPESNLGDILAKRLCRGAVNCALAGKRSILDLLVPSEVGDEDVSVAVLETEDVYDLNHQVECEV